MAYTTYDQINLLANIDINDIPNATITSIIAEATKELNRMINTRVVRERVEYIDSTRENKLDGSNTIFYVKNWKGKFLADSDNDGSVGTSDVIVYQVSSDGTETKPTISAIDVDDCYVTLSSAPTAGVLLYITYEWCFKNQSTPDPLIKLACTLLSTAYCYAKLNVDMAPQQGPKNSYEHYYKRFLNIVRQINNEMPTFLESEETF